MAVWRRKAIEAFPLLSDSLNTPRYMLVDLCWDVHQQMQRAPDQVDDLLPALLNYAVWCFQQPDLRHEILFACYDELWRNIPHDRWDAAMETMSPEIIRASWAGWERSLSLAELLDLRALALKHTGSVVTEDELPISSRRHSQRR